MDDGPTTTETWIIVPVETHLCYQSPAYYALSIITSLNLLLHHHIVCMKPVVVVVVVVVVSTSGHSLILVSAIIIIIIIIMSLVVALCFVRVNQKPPAKTIIHPLEASYLY